MNVTVAELNFRGVDCSVVDFECFVGTTNGGARRLGVGFERIVVGPELFILLTCYYALLDQSSITFDLGSPPVLTRNLAREVCFGLFLRRDVFSEIRLRLF